MKDVTNPLWTYEEIAPEKRTYRTAFYPANQVYALNAADKQEEYIAYCEQAGWHYVTNWDNMLILKKTPSPWKQTKPCGWKPLIKP
ncbi:DUF2812 domain-containing protein [Anaerotignum sp.]|uniref:DUF2812 domain-containing protein n=1 Tax=Anaerotignum sp. TaxID=2039241 RepID=UPI003A932FE2